MFCLLNSFLFSLLHEVSQAIEMKDPLANVLSPGVINKKKKMRIKNNFRIVCGLNLPRLLLLLPPEFFEN